MGNKKVLVTGKGGQLGRSIKKISDDLRDYEFIYTGRSELDLSDEKIIDDYFKNRHFDIIINCAAYTSVDLAETETELSYQLNCRAVKKLAEISKDKGILLVHISTDYVFDGNKDQPYSEDDQTNPINSYGLSKLEGENAIKEAKPNSLIIRTSWLYSEFGNNFLKNIIKLGLEKKDISVIDDQIGTPTYAGDLAKAIFQIIDIREKHKNNNRRSSVKVDSLDLYHFSNEGACSWYIFAKRIFEIANLNCSIKPISYIDFKSSTKRPGYSVMSKSKIYKLGISIPHWESSLIGMIKNTDLIK